MTNDGLRIRQRQPACALSRIWIFSAFFSARCNRTGLPIAYSQGLQSPSACCPSPRRWRWAGPANMKSSGREALRAHGPQAAPRTPMRAALAGGSSGAGRAHGGRPSIPRPWPLVRCADYEINSGGDRGGDAGAAEEILTDQGQGGAWRVRNDRRSGERESRTCAALALCMRARGALVAVAAAADAALRGHARSPTCWSPALADLVGARSSGRRAFTADACWREDDARRAGDRLMEMEPMNKEIIVDRQPYADQTRLAAARGRRAERAVL